VQTGCTPIKEWHTVPRGSVLKREAPNVGSRQFYLRHAGILEGHAARLRILVRAIVFFSTGLQKTSLSVSLAL
jgi:hypothetical protein